MSKELLTMKYLIATILLIFSSSLLADANAVMDNISNQQAQRQNAISYDQQYLQIKNRISEEQIKNQRQSQSSATDCIPDGVNGIRCKTR